MVMIWDEPDGTPQSAINLFITFESPAVGKKNY